MEIADFYEEMHTLFASTGRYPRNQPVKVRKIYLLYGDRFASRYSRLFIYFMRHTCCIVTNTITSHVLATRSPDPNSPTQLFPSLIPTHKSRMNEEVNTGTWQSSRRETASRVQKMI